MAARRLGARRRGRLAPDSGVWRRPDTRRLLIDPTAPATTPRAADSEGIRRHSRRQVLGYALLGVLFLAGLIFAAANDSVRGDPITISEARRLIESGRVESATLVPDAIEIVVRTPRGSVERLPDGEYSAMYDPSLSPDLDTLLATHDVPYSLDPARGAMRDLMLLRVVPALLAIGLWLFFRQLTRPRPEATSEPGASGAPQSTADSDKS